jgi:hypothetical protein
VRCDKLSEIVEELAEIDENILIADGFDDAILGYVEFFGCNPVALYDKDKCIQILMERDGLDDTSAIEHFYFNVSGSYVGDYTPAFATLLDNGNHYLIKRDEYYGDW